MTTTREIGQSFEARALAFLQAQGLKLIQQNYRTRVGEIDLIMQEKEVLIFVEVRFRQSDEFGEAGATVLRSKQRKIIRSAQSFLQKIANPDSLACRFDVISMTIDQIDWIKDAFQLKNGFYA